MQPEQPIFSVTEISLSLKACVEQVFGHVKVRGEVSGVKRAASGHIYFSLKDNDSVLSAVAWRGRDKTTNAAIQEGLEIICTGKLSTYPGRSNYQMIVESAEPAGIGALLKLLNDRREKLAKEGLFDESRKKKIPYLPQVIGVITSPTGAVIRDIMHRLRDRFPRQVILWPVLVQGTEAASQITAAIKGFNAIPPEGIDLPCKNSGPVNFAADAEQSVCAPGCHSSVVQQENDRSLFKGPGTEPGTTPSYSSLTSIDASKLDNARDLQGKLNEKQQEMCVSLGGMVSDMFQNTGARPSGCVHLPRPDVLIVARGGGSLEDLWAFNEESVVRAAAESAIPLISAVGHETDTTLIDYAADRRAPTPTAAAEMAVPVRNELLTRLSGQKTRLMDGAVKYLTDKQMKIKDLSRAIPNLSDLINTFIQKLDDRSERLQISLNNYVKNKENQFVNLKNLLKSYSYTAVLERGFALVSDQNAKIVASAPVAKCALELTIAFIDGKVTTIPVSNKTGESGAKTPMPLQGPLDEKNQSPFHSDDTANNIPHDCDIEVIRPASALNTQKLKTGQTNKKGHKPHAVPSDDIHERKKSKPVDYHEKLINNKTSCEQKISVKSKGKKNYNPFADPNQKGLFDDL